MSAPRTPSLPPSPLVVVSHVPHHLRDGRLWAYEPYAREMEVWADLFPRLVIAAPRGEGPPGPDAAPIDRPGVELAPQAETGGTTAAAKLRQLALLPALVLSLNRALARARPGGAIHVRCPGNLGLLGALLAPLFSRRLVAKYAGQWPDYPGEPATVRLQKRLLASRWWRGPVTVYGDWSSPSPRVVPFFTSVMDEAQVARARRSAEGRFGHGWLRRWEDSGEPFHLLFVGRLSREKHPETLVEAVGLLAARGVPARATLVGDGPLAGELAARARELGVADRVSLVGAVPFEAVAGHYEAADLLVLTSESEGWPKVVAEAMAFGVVPVASHRGLIPWMLGADGGGESRQPGARGVTVPPADPEALAEAIAALRRDPAELAALGGRAAAWAGEWSLPGLRTALARLLTERWDLPADAFPPAGPPASDGETRP